MDHIRNEVRMDSSSADRADMPQRARNYSTFTSFWKGTPLFIQIELRQRGYIHENTWEISLLFYHNVWRLCSLCWHLPVAD